ncbi:MAG: flagellar hook-length control protein FliK [Campylobacterota bacterium]|nr:flagellar hook-length control protein FliK [Campylobacterota bacterium]
MISLTGNSKQLDILLPNTNKALAEVLKNATPKELQTLSQSKDLKSILNSLLTQSSQNPASDKTLLELLKNNPTLKSLGSATDNIKALLNAVKSDRSPLPIETTLKNSLTNIKDLSETALKQKFENSGVFLESKLKNASPQNAKEIMANDLKAVLLKATDEISASSNPNKSEILRQVDKLLLQIDYHQLLSHLSNSSSLYIPFSWEDMQEGQINLKKDKNDTFYCDIDLKLKEYGELNIRLTLYEKNQLNIHIHSDNKEFKEIIKENISSLRLALTESKITPREIRLLGLTKTENSSAYEENSTNIDMGFEVKV